jgi:hypothetical protein
MKKQELNFEQDLSIDRYKLDQECVTHSQLYYRYSELAAESKNQVGILSDDLKLKMGEANIIIRNHLIEQGVKFTEAVINAEVEKDRTVIATRDKLRDAEINYSRLQAGVFAFEHRKSQLDNLVRLYCAGYFSTPGQSGKPKDSINKQVSREVRARLNAKKRSAVDEEDDN